MRQKRTTQTSLFDPDPVDHPVGATLEAISAWLDDHPEWFDAVAADLGTVRDKAVGRLGLSCETVLRCAVVRHLHQLSWRGLEFFLRARNRRADSRAPGPAARAEEIRFAGDGGGRDLGAAEPLSAGSGAISRRGLGNTGQGWPRVTRSLCLWKTHCDHFDHVSNASRQVLEMPAQGSM